MHATDLNHPPLLTFEQFIARRRWSNDIDADTGLDPMDPERPMKGFIYPEYLYIEKTTNDYVPRSDGRRDWHLVLYNTFHDNDDLRELEKTLYAFYLAEIHGRGSE